MPLVFSPLSESILDTPFKKLLPRHAFAMRQLGSPDALDIEIYERVKVVFRDRGMTVIDADGTTGSKDYLERIVDLIRSTGFTVAIFSDKTRNNSLCNICLELGFAAMCGKPIIITKSEGSTAPSDLKRTDWIDYSCNSLDVFDKKLKQALDQIESLSRLELTLCSVTLEARSPDCAIAFERIIKGFLISGDKAFVESAQELLVIVEKIEEGNWIADLERLRSEIKTFVRQAK